MNHPKPKHDPYNVNLGYYIGSNPFRAIAKKHNVNLTIVYTIADNYIHRRDTYYYRKSTIRLAEKYGEKATVNLNEDIQKAIVQLWSK